jgi:hypothetical protein
MITYRYLREAGFNRFRAAAVSIRRAWLRYHCRKVQQARQR